MTIRKYTSQELSAGGVQVWSHGQYRLELGRTSMQGTYYVRFHEGRINHSETFFRLSDAHTRFNWLVRHWETEVEIRELTERLMYSACPNSNPVMYPLRTGNAHRFEFDSFDQSTVCVYCGLVKGEM